MSLDVILTSVVEGSVLFTIIWIVFRLAPAIPPDWKAWIWRLAFLKPLIGLVPLAAIRLHVLPPVDAASPSPGTPRYSAEGPIRRVVERSEGEAPGIPFPIDPWLVVWIVGVGAVSLHGLRERLRAGRVMQTAERVTNPAVRDALQELARRAGVTPPRLLCSTDVQSAMLVGGRGATIVLPESAIDPNSVSDARLMLAHEVAHLARRDLSWFGAIWLVRSLLFFNPIVWLAARSARQDHESATDRRAAELAATSIQTYAEMLLRATVVARTPLIPAAIPMAESYRTIHRRMEAMNYFNRQPTLSRTLATMALAGVTVGLIPTYLPSAVASPARPQAATQNTDYFRQNANPMQVAGPDGVRTVTTYSGSFEQQDVRIALQHVFSVTHKAFEIDHSVHGLVTLDVQNVTFDVLLQNIVRQANAGYRVEKDTYVVYPLPPSQVPVIYSRPLPTSYPPINIDVSVKQVDVREALRTIWRHVHRSFKIDEQVQGTVSLQATNEPLESVLKRMLAQVDSEFHIEKGLYVITRKKPSS